MTQLSPNNNPVATTEWFKEWFNSPFYHVLYQNRNEHEAACFLFNLSQKLGFKAEHHILDLACGKGRHAIWLNQQGYRVTGIDLAPQNIAFAQQYANEKLQFFVGDMRDVFQAQVFDFILNLFTSFGYFAQESDHLQCLSAIHTMLKPKGKLVLDFMNTTRVVQEMRDYEIKTIDDIDFHIYKKIERGYLVKDIEFEHENQDYSFQECVKIIDYVTFLHLFEQCGFEPIEVWGNYQLAPYEVHKADRMIWLVKAKA